MINLLKTTLHEHKEEYLQCLKDLVARDTQDLGHGIAGGREKAGQEYMEALFRRMGASEIIKDQMSESVILKCYETYGEGNLGHNYEDRYNVYATFKGKDGSKSLMFNGHIDTMPPGDEKEWMFPPHTPTVKDGKLYGLGAADMKAGLMASVMAVKLLQDAGIALPCDVKITSVCDEEGGGNGSMQAAMNGQKADGVIVCEPTDGGLVVAHMGFVFFKVEFEGKANHSGEKRLGVSAIEKAMKVIRGLEELEHGWLLNYKHPLLPSPSLNVGTIHGGTAGSTVAGKCYFETCIHYLPQSCYEKVYNEFTSVVNDIARSDPWMREHMPKITMYQSGGAFEEEVGAPLVQTMLEAYKEAVSEEVSILGSPAGCDSRIWKRITGAQVMQYGPGRQEQCHSVNEYVEIESFYRAILVYAQLILLWAQK